MQVYLVERYVPGLDGALAAALAERVRAATAGTEVAWLGSVVVLDEETLLCLFSSASETEVRSANHRANVRLDRVVSVELIR